MKNPYEQFVSDYQRVIDSARKLPMGGLPPLRPAASDRAPKALVFAPHPDDECIVGALALRLRTDLDMNVINVAVTQGSRKDRQQARYEELRGACTYLGFGLVKTRENGLEKVNPKTRREDPALWGQSVAIIAGLLSMHRPKVIFVPHEADWNSTHIGTHYLVMDALLKADPAFSCVVVETEYWQAMNTPNLMAEVTPRMLAEMIEALTFHVGEVERNPYHLGLPGWMQDNVRRGAEIVGGQGGKSPDYAFATLYRVRRWAAGALQELYTGGRFLGAGDNIRELLGL